MLKTEVMGGIWELCLGLNRREGKGFEEREDLCANQDTEDSWCYPSASAKLHG